ncbi:MAG: hypothetical protein QOE68_1235 [Thermoanaerobaculia bacterium]|nr:hypothetical protein [Thermoanaerobaculia bacterium]
MRPRLMRLLIVVIVAALAGLLTPIHSFAQNAPAKGERYLIILKPQKNNVPELSDLEVAAVGGKVEFKASGRLDVTLPAGAVEALRKHGRVKYIQKAVIGPPPPPNAASVVRLKPQAMSLHPRPEATPPTWLSGTYLYDKSGNIYAVGIAGDTGAPPQHRYAYDNLSRLTAANSTALLQPNETFEYDDYGNMTSHHVGANATTMSVVTATNRFTAGGASPYQYDDLGNLTADAEATYAYDPFSMLREKDYFLKMPEFYIYTASDERIGVKYSNLSDSVTTWSIRDFSGNVLRQFKGMDDQPFATWLWVEDYIYRDGQLLGADRVPEEGGRRHFHLDHLGSPRLVTSSDETSSKEMSEHDFAPFGMEVNPLWQESVGGFDREDPKRFTAHERDYASDGQLQTTRYLDYMHARYYNPGVGRFLSVDATVDVDRALSNPQLWNRYSYGADNPMKYFDPDGNANKIYLLSVLPSDRFGVAESVADLGPFIADTTGYTLDVRTGLTAATALSRFKKVDASDYVILESHGGGPKIQSEISNKTAPRETFTDNNIISALGNSQRPSAIILSGCSTQEAAQHIAQHTGVMTFGTTAGVESTEGTRAATVLAHALAETGNVKFALQQANRIIKSPVCHEGNCGPVAQFVVYPATR